MHHKLRVHISYSYFADPCECSGAAKREEKQATLGSVGVEETRVFHTYYSHYVPENMELFLFARYSVSFGDCCLWKSLRV